MMGADRRHASRLSALAVAAALLFCCQTGFANVSAANKMKASVISEQATKLYLGGQHEAAEKLFLEAYALDPALGYLYSAARAAHKGDRLKSAKSIYERVIAANAQGQFGLKAAHHLADVRKRMAEAAKPAPLPTASWMCL